MPSPSDPSLLSPLGKPTEYRATYAPDLLYPISRRIKRDELGIDSDRLPFVGEDLWNAYELSWLNPRGKPVVALGTFRVPAASPNLVESKSLKLYLNSFNQTTFADAAAVEATVARDLAAAAGAAVAVTVTDLNDQAPVITSNVTSLPEVVGKAGLTHAPEDTQGLTEAMAKMLGDFNTRTHFQRAGLVRAQEFSWERAARATQAVYDEVFNYWHK